MASKMMSFIGRLTSVGMQALFPARCCHCDRLFKLPRDATKGVQSASACSFQALMGAFVCEACGQRFQAIQSPLCEVCGRPFDSPHSLDHLCGVCHEKPPGFQAARSLGRYDGPLRTVIHQYKYHGWVQMAVPLARLLWVLLQVHWDPIQFDYVVPVPLHPRRLRQRGFNQAGLLAQRWPALAVAQGLALDHKRIASRLLVRIRHTAPQTGLNRPQRVTNLKQAFAVADLQAVKDKQILLVDDVLTTGATADACARVLLGAGAADVRVLTLARAV